MDSAKLSRISSAIKSEEMKQSHVQSNFLEANRRLLTSVNGVNLKRAEQLRQSFEMERKQSLQHLKEWVPAVAFGKQYKPGDNAQMQE